MAKWVDAQGESKCRLSEALVGCGNGYAEESPYSAKRDEYQRTQIQVS